MNKKSDQKISASDETDFEKEARGRQTGRRAKGLIVAKRLKRNKDLLIARRRWKETCLEIDVNDQREFGLKPIGVVWHRVNLLRPEEIGEADDDEEQAGKTMGPMLVQSLVGHRRRCWADNTKTALIAWIKTIFLTTLRERNFPF